MERECPKCGKITADDRLIRCPDCNSSFTNFGRQPVVLSPEQEEQLYKKLIGRLKVYVFGSFSVIGAISFVLMFDSLNSIYNRSVEFLNGRVLEKVEQQFQQPRIEETVRQVAADQAKTLLSEQIRPQVERLQAETTKSVQNIQSITKELEAQYKADYANLTNNVNAVEAQNSKANKLTNQLSLTVTNLQQRSDQYDRLSKSVQNILDDLNHRKRIADIADRAITKGDRPAFLELNKIAEVEQNETMKQLAQSEILRIKSFWVSGSATRGTSLQKDGKSIKTSDLNTCELISTVKLNPTWQARAVAVAELGGRKNVGVPEAILDAIKTDPNLGVLKDAVIAWGQLTGYMAPDVFGESFIKTWWDEHHIEFSKGLTQPKCD